MGAFQIVTPIVGREGHCPLLLLGFVSPQTGDNIECPEAYSPFYF